MVTINFSAMLVIGGFFLCALIGFMIGFFVYKFKIMQPLREKREQEKSIARAALLLLQDKREGAVAIVSGLIPEVWEMHEEYLGIAQQVCRAYARKLFDQAKAKFDREEFAEAREDLNTGITYLKFSGTTDLPESVAQLRSELDQKPA
jgi:hypothetical protein